jgi:hypothetical protein
MTFTIKPSLSLSLLPNALQLSWPLNSSNWYLQYQTNLFSMALGANWMDVRGPLTNPFVVPIYPGVGSAFYRLVFTNQ